MPTPLQATLLPPLLATPLNLHPIASTCKGPTVPLLPILTVSSSHTHSHTQTHTEPLLLWVSTGPATIPGTHPGPSLPARLLPPTETAIETVHLYSLHLCTQDGIEAGGRPCTLSHSSSIVTAWSPTLENNLSHTESLLLFDVDSNRHRAAFPPLPDFQHYQGKDFVTEKQRGVCVCVGLPRPS